MSRRKYTSTAATVPSWMMASNAAPGSGQSSNAGTMRRCAVELMGKNSVMPWTSTRTTARRRPMKSGPSCQEDTRRASHSKHPFE